MEYENMRGTGIKSSHKRSWVKKLFLDEKS